MRAVEAVGRCHYGLWEVSRSRAAGWRECELRAMMAAVAVQARERSERSSMFAGDDV
jgi:hypothetical protein